MSYETVEWFTFSFVVSEPPSHYDGEDEGASLERHRDYWPEAAGLYVFARQEGLIL